MGRVEKCGMLDGREDVEVGECTNDGEEDNGLYGRVGCMQREGPEEGAHVVSQEEERTWAENNTKRIISFLSHRHHSIIGHPGP